MTETTLTGYAAIEYAEMYGMRLAKHADPIEDARSDLTIEEAREVATEDPSLIYLPVDRDLTTQIRDLMTEAGAAGDYEQVVLCLEALGEDDGRFGDVKRVGRQAALVECEWVIRQAREG